MKKSSFENFLINRTLEQLLNLMINEKEIEKIQSIKKVINLKVNYYNDQNEKLKGWKLYKHQKHIKKRYINTIYEPYINFSKFKFYKFKLFYLLLLLFSLIIYYQKTNLFEYYSKIRSYQYNNIDTNYQDLNKLLTIKINLGNKYIKDKESIKAYEAYLSAYNIYLKLNKPQEAQNLENKLTFLKREIYILLENRYIKIKNSSNYKNQQIELNEIYNIARNTQLYNTQGKILELQGDFFLKKFSLKDTETFYQKALKAYSNDPEVALKEIKEKIYNIEILITITKNMNEIKILKLNNENSKANSLLKKTIKLFNNLNSQYKFFEIEKNINELAERNRSI